MRRRDTGAAAVELALVLPVLLGALTLVLPLALLLHLQTALGNTAGETVRLATSRAEQERLVGGAVVARGALPSPEQATEEAKQSFTSRALLPTSTITATTGVTASTLCPTGRRRTVRLVAEVALGPAAVLLGGSTTKTLRATATSCEE